MPRRTARHIDVNGPMGHSGPYLLDVVLDRDRVPSFDEYPFKLDVVRNLSKLELHPQVTFFVGENGSGKSTLLEAIAVGWGLNAEGGSANFDFATRQSHSPLHEKLTLNCSPIRPRDSYFLRAETFYNVATEIEKLDSEGTHAKLTAAYGGKSLHEQSHGESFFALFQNRFGGRGLYLLDEPEAALSPKRQMSFLTQLHLLVQAGSQFLIATHSPIIMAYPDAWIYQIDSTGLSRVAWKETDHYFITKAFLTRTEPMLKELLADE